MSDEERREYLIESIAEIIERKGTSTNKAQEIVDGILYPAIDEVALSFRILERVHLPRGRGSEN